MYGKEGITVYLQMSVGDPGQSRSATTYFLVRSSHFGIGRNFASDTCAGQTITRLPFWIWMAKPSMVLSPCSFAFHRPRTVYTVMEASASRIFSGSKPPALVPADSRVMIAAQPIKLLRSASSL